MKMLTYLLVGLSTCALVASAEKPITEDKEWGNACGGSNIAVTSVAGRMVSIDAVMENFAQGRQWQCHFKDGKIVTALYRHYMVTRKSEGDGGKFSTELKEDKVELFYFPDHQIVIKDIDLKNELLEVLAIATQKSKLETGPASKR